MFIIGITGGIGSGKTSVAEIFAQRGVRVLDADEISRTVTGVGGSALAEIQEAFGNKATDSRFSLNRKYMASLVFSDRTKLDHLSSLIHRYVLEEMSIAIEKERENKTKAIVLDVPIPVKKGFLDVCDQIWVVSADDSVRLHRLIDRGMDTEDARRRMSMQMTREEYEELADVVIDNNGTVEDLRAKVDEIIIRELHERGIRI
jgi:dephospho-CoA kinase